MTLFELNSQDKASTAWRKLVEHYTERLHMLRVQNDAKCSAEDTAFRRGQINEIRALLELDDEKPRL